MLIRCKKTRRFLVEIKIEEYLDNLHRIGVKQELPLEIVIPCPRCHKKEIYEIYDNRYVYKGNKE